MQIRLTIGLALGVIILPTFTLFATNPVQARERDRHNNRDPHYYCARRARNRTTRFLKRDNIGNVAEDAIGGAILGAIIGGIAGDAEKGAGIGAGLVVVGGGTRRAKNRKAFYRREYNACMRRNRR